VKEILGARRILDNVRKLKGYRTNREVAEFFGVGASSITDWVTRKGDRIPARRLMEAARRHELNWSWLAYGEGPPRGELLVEVRTGVALEPGEMEVLEKIKASPAFRKAVHGLLGLDDARVRLVARVAESMASAPPLEPPPRLEPDRPAEERAVHTWRTGFPLTKTR